ncbi:MAG: hypothetical protein H0X36_01280, partial [Sphingomonadaceae bacterium]|nr:hypothetical protein [Sphingomonadaceae bacterium]
MTFIEQQGSAAQYRRFANSAEAFVRRLLILPLLLAPAPALAHYDHDTAVAADVLADPATARTAGRAVEAATASIMDLRIDGVIRAFDPEIDGVGPVPRTLGEAIAPDDPGVARRAGRDAAHAVAAAGSATRAVA